MASVFKNILIKLMLVCSAASAIFIMATTQSCDCLSKLFFHGITLDATQQAGKWLLLRALFSRIALFLFLHAAVVMHLRIFTNKSSPATEQDSTPIKVINRIITNTVEQTIIFAGLYIYFLFDVSGDRFTSTQLVNFASWFILSRIIFSACYLLGTLIGVSTIRGFGFALSVGTNLILLENIFLPKTYLTPLLFGSTQ